ncbi:Anaphase-promoting complex subunit 10, partial [Stegodyphus mimosarum]
MELNEPSGWVRIPLKDVLDQPIRTYLVQIAVLSNHQNGRDTHLRQIRVHSPVENNCFAAIKFPMLTSIECLAYSTIR